MHTDPAAPAGSADDMALLGLLQLVSPALPIGAFAWSQGLESAFELGLANDEEALGDWLAGVLEDGLTRCELPLIKRQLHAWRRSDSATLEHWDSWLAATRETRELAAEDRQLGAALKRLAKSLGWLPETPALPIEAGYVSVFAALAGQRGLDARRAMLGFAWAWLENQLAAACKALPLGHTAAQRLIERLRPALGDAVERAWRLDDDQLGPMLPGLALASALHETQYSRLFRS